MTGEENCRDDNTGNRERQAKIEIGAKCYAILAAMNKTATRAWSNDWRQWATDRAHGLVLEIGAGDGVNLEYYHSDAQVIATEPDAKSLESLQDCPSNVVLARVSAEELPFPDASFDAVVGTLVFCTIPDAALALQEVKRVLKPGGSLRLVEHVRAKNRLGRAFMQFANPAWHWMTGGCNLNRDTLTAVRAAGFHVLTTHKQVLGLVIGIDARK